MELSINDKTYNVVDDPAQLLLWVLRDELGLTGTKFGCGAGICGSCTVHIDGVPTRACITPLVAIKDTAQIRTIEGLAHKNEDGTLALHGVQEAFLEEQVPQCGWCMSGQIMTAAAFLAENPNPSAAEIEQAMSQNYCRCSTYVRIKKAVARAAVLHQEREETT